MKKKKAEKKEWVQPKVLELNLGKDRKIAHSAMAICNPFGDSCDSGIGPDC